MKKRNIALCIIFSIITCGIYGIYWFVTITDDSNELSSTNKTASGVLALIYTLITCGIYGIYWTYKLGEKTDEINGTQSNGGILFVILSVLGLSIVNMGIAQDAINKRC